MNNPLICFYFPKPYVNSKNVALLHHPCELSWIYYLVTYQWRHSFVYPLYHIRGLIHLFLVFVSCIPAKLCQILGL